MELSLVPVCHRRRSGDSYFCDLLGLAGVIVLRLVPHGIVGRPVKCPSPRSPRHAVCPLGSWGPSSLPGAPSSLLLSDPTDHFLGDVAFVPHLP